MNRTKLLFGPNFFLFGGLSFGRIVVWLQHRCCNQIIATQHGNEALLRSNYEVGTDVDEEQGMMKMQGWVGALWRKRANEAYEAGEEEFGAGTQAGDARLRHLKPHLPILMHPLSQSAKPGWQKIAGDKNISEREKKTGRGSSSFLKPLVKGFSPVSIFLIQI